MSGGGWQPSRALGRNVTTDVGEPMHGGEGMARVDDRAHVRACLALGGFPRIFVLDGKVFWLDAAAGEWAYGRAPAVLGVSA